MQRNAPIKKSLAVAGALLLAAPLVVEAQAIRRVDSFPRKVWFVDDDACPGVGVGTRGDPFCTIQQGIDAAHDGDRVLVAPGSYLERIDFLGKAIAVVASEGPSRTAIEREYPFHGTLGAVFQNGEGPDSVLDGFTIARHADFYGGAVQCTGSSPTIVRNVIRDNLSHGILCEDSPDVRILSNVISDNSLYGPSLTGTGVLARDSTLRIAGNVILDNYLDSNTGFGAGVYLEDCTAAVENNLIAENRAVYLGGSGGNRGGGLHAFRSNVVLRGNTFTKNLASPTQYVSGEGGAIASVQSELRISGTILWNDAAPHVFGPGEEGPEIWAENSFVHVDHSDVQGGTAEIVATGGALEWGDGNLDTEPAFVDSAASNYHLSAVSPLIEMGPPAQASKGIDVDADPRVLDGDENGIQRVDMGADERNVTKLTAAGAATLGSAVTFTTLAPPNRSYMLFLGTKPGDTPNPPYGAFLVGLAGIQVVGSGTVPGEDVVPIPPIPSLLGEELWAQSLAIDTGTTYGSLSNVLRFVIH